MPSRSKFPGLRRTPIGYLAGFLFQEKNKEQVLGLCTGTGTNGVGQLTSNTLSSMDKASNNQTRKEKKKDKEKYLHESSRNINGIGPRCALLRAHLDVL